MPLGKSPTNRVLRYVLSSSRGGRLSLILMLTGVSAFACGGSQNLVPETSAAGSREAQRDLRNLETEWEVSDDVGRQALRERLEKFISEYASDPSSARARILLAQISLSEGELARVESILKPIVDGPLGSARDEGIVILAAVDNRRDNFIGALEKLAPLEGKLLTRDARNQYSQERTAAAIKAARWRLTYDSMLTWLSDEAEDPARVRAWIRAALVFVPTSALSEMMQFSPQESSQAKHKKASVWLNRLLIERLTEEAIAKRDPLLARDLLARSPPWLRASENGDELSLLAALAHKEARVEGRIVGVVLGGSTDQERRDSVRMAVGILRGLGLGEAEETSHSIGFLAVENRDSVDTALGILSGLGASILVAGVNASGAAEALLFAEKNRVAVVTMQGRASEKKSAFGFSMGVTHAQEMQGFRTSVSEPKNWIMVGTEKNPCDDLALRPGTFSFPLSLWKTEGAEALGVLGDAHCARNLAAQLGAMGWSPLLVAGLLSGDGRFSNESQIARLAVGRFPEFDVQSTGDDMSELERDLQKGKKTRSPPPSDWYFSLGHDAAQLISAALQTLPKSPVTDKAQVRARHRQARVALSQARADLRTTNTRGFSPQNEIEREFSLLSTTDHQEGNH